jgi:cytochrome c553
MEKSPTLIISVPDGRSSLVAQCSACHQTFPLSTAAMLDPLVGQRELKNTFEAHVKDKHSWRADGNETAALRLREMMKDFE